jgi:lipid-binding SYLF domain-containing protein
MKYFFVPVLISVFLLSGSIAANAAAAPRELDHIQSATRLIDEMPGKIPSGVLGNAKAIAIFSNDSESIGDGFLKGIIVTRLPDGAWSPPAFVELAGGRFTQRFDGRDIVLITNSDAAKDYILGGPTVLGVDVEMAPGQVGSKTGSPSDIPGVYLYATDRSGALVGAMLTDNPVLAPDQTSNFIFYAADAKPVSSCCAMAPDPLQLKLTQIPAPARAFSCQVSKATGSGEKTCS